jgi:hypothetical protein
MPTIHLAHSSDFAFVDALLRFGEGYSPEPGDLIEAGDFETEDDEELECDQARVVSNDGETIVLRDEATGREVRGPADQWFQIAESPAISSLWEQMLRRPKPDGVAFADGLVDPALEARLRADVQRLIDLEPVDYHPGSGTRVRDLVHPSLYPLVEGRSAPKIAALRPPAPDYDRFGRTYESSRYQWLPTPFAIDEAGQAKALSYINNLDPTRHAAAYDDLAALLTTALPLLESVTGYVESTTLWRDDCEGIEHEGELPQDPERKARPAPPRSLRGREILVIPKIVEYRLGAGETHEGVWHVEGMSHEHIIAACVYILDRDEALEGGELRFKRPYTIEEAGRVFWNIDQCRPRAVEEMVDEGTIPLGSVATPQGRIVVFPNSHIHKLSALSVRSGAAEARRRVIVFWLVDPSVTLTSTREVPPQQGVIPHEEALKIRLELMEERKRHKQTLNVRAVSLCEH